MTQFPSPPIGIPQPPPSPPPTSRCCNCCAAPSGPDGSSRPNPSRNRDPPSRSPSPQRYGRAADSSREDGTEPTPAVAEALGSMLASCRIRSPSPDSAIDRSFIATGLAAQTLEKFLKQRPGRDRNHETETDTETEPKSGAMCHVESAGRAVSEWQPRNRTGSMTGLRCRGSGWHTVRGCCAAVEVLSGTGCWERRGETEPGGVQTGPNRGTAGQGNHAWMERHRNRHRDGNETCGCCGAAGSGGAARNVERPPSPPCLTAPDPLPTRPRSCDCSAPRRHRHELRRELRVTSRSCHGPVEMGGGPNRPPPDRCPHHHHYHHHHQPPPQQSRRAPPRPCQPLNAVQFVTKSFELRAHRDAAKAERDGGRVGSPPGGEGG
ncbi:uncharacterized protein LOC107307245, partial [Coturnix japonica]|uniref:uncharacterized protein LOC107307245 n=1 Tax=Coturnix japonica TaxID=93934 RepID=UPI000777AA5A